MKKAVNNCKCLVCKKEFHIKQSQLDKGRGKYCSRTCYGKVRSEWMKDRRINPVYRINFKGENNPNWRGGKKVICIDCGKILTSLNLKTLRCARCNYNFYTGENNPMWIPNKIIFYPSGWNRTFKEQIRYRDGYKCQVCGVPEEECMTNLPIHHIDYDKLNLDSNNLVSLCNSCHAKTNFNRKYWKKYFLKGGEVNKFAFK